MSFSNTNYLYENLPSRYRREDQDWFLKRYLQHFGESLDDYDQAFDSFSNSIDSPTADGRWIKFWLENLFGWSWFPRWFTTADKRRLYANFGRHLARRGTRRGIELFLLDFGIVARVHTRRLPWGEGVWGESHFAVNEPLRLIVEILFIRSSPTDANYWGEGVWGESFDANPLPPFTEKEITDLLRFGQPHAQELIVLWRVADTRFVPPVIEATDGGFPLYGEPLYGEIITEPPPDAVPSEPPIYGATLFGEE